MARYAVFGCFSTGWDPTRPPASVLAAWAGLAGCSCDWTLLPLPAMYDPCHHQELWCHSTVEAPFVVTRDLRVMTCTEGAEPTRITARRLRGAVTFSGRQRGAPGYAISQTSALPGHGAVATGWMPWGASISGPGGGGGGLKQSYSGASRGGRPLQPPRLRWGV